MGAKRTGRFRFRRAIVAAFASVAGLAASELGAQERSDAGQSIERKDERRIEGTVYFATDSARLPKNFEQLYEDTIHLLRERPELRVTVQGHTDQRASYAYNLRLSLRRSQAVARGLIENGVKPEQIVIVGRGETCPVRTGTSAHDLRANRRATFCIEVDESLEPEMPDRMPEITVVPLIASGQLIPSGSHLSIQAIQEIPSERVPATAPIDELTIGYTLNVGLEQTRIHYSPAPRGPGDRTVYRTTTDVGGSAFISKWSVPIAEADAYFGVTDGRTYGGGSVTVHPKSVDDDKTLYLRAATVYTVAFNRVNPVELGIAKRATEDDPFAIRAGVIPLSYFYESRGFGGELGAGMQLWGSGMHVKGTYTFKDFHGLRLMADLEPIVGWVGTNRTDMFGAETDEHGKVEGSLSPFLNTRLQANLPIADQWEVMSSVQWNWLKYRATTGVRTASETAAKLSIIYTPK